MGASGKLYSKMKLFTFLVPFTFSFPDQSSKVGELSSQAYGNSDCSKKSVTTTSNAKNCQKICEYSSKCYFWTYWKANKNCYLKNEHGWTKVEKSDTTCGNKNGSIQWENVDCYGGDAVYNWEIII